MALHHQLPIYKVAYDLADLAVDLVRQMPRDVKDVIGRDLRGDCLRILVLIFRANVATDKVPHLLELVERLQVVELLLRLSCDKRFISKPQYGKAIDFTSAIGRQANGWRKASSASSPAT